MFKPNYTLTPKLVTNLTKIERLYGHLEALQIPKMLELSLERDNLIKSSYISNSIEGNPLTKAEVTNLILDDRVPANRDEQEIRNYFDILKDLSHYEKTVVSISLITQIHERLLTHVDPKIAGQIRNTAVIVGGYKNIDGKRQLVVKHEPPAHDKYTIELLLTDLNNWYANEHTMQVLLKIASYHHEFVFIHPFADGNGRVCRLLTGLLLLQAGYGINRYFVLDDYYDVDRPYYSDMLKTADTGDKTDWLEYFTDGLLYSLQSAKARIEAQMGRLSVSLQPTYREREILAMIQDYRELTSIVVSKKLKVTRQQAHKLLSGLVEKGFIQKKGSTKSAYYKIK